MKGPTDQYVLKLYETAGKKLELLKELFELTEKQQEALMQEDTDLLGDYIEQKQSHIDRINILDEEFNDTFTRLKQALGVGSLSELQASSIQGADILRHVIGEIINLISDISQLETSNSKLVKSIINKVADDIRKINQGKMVGNAYAAKAQPDSSYFLDKKK